MGLYIIAILKLVSAGLLFTVALGAFRLLDANLAETIAHLVHKLRLDPEKESIMHFMASASGLSHRQLQAISAGTLLYGILYLVEGVGLLLKKAWAEYMVVVITMSFLPLELYEIIEKFSFLRVSVLAVNIIIAVYLTRLLLRKRRAKRYLS